MMEAIRRSARKSWMSYRKLRNCNCVLFCRICLEDCVALLCSLSVSMVIFQFYSVMRFFIMTWDLYKFSFQGLLNLASSVRDIRCAHAETSFSNGVTTSTEDLDECQQEDEHADDSEAKSVPDVPPKPVQLGHSKNIKRKREDSEEFPVISSTRTVMSKKCESPMNPESKKESPKQVVSFQKDAKTPQKSDDQVESDEEVQEVVKETEEL